jgi:prepilin-type N-terminal cleavage/methylation domain-containing protein
VKRRRGFSLIEILAVLAVLGIILAISSLSLRGSSQRAEPRAVAQLLASELEAVHRRAVSEHTTIALALPSSSGVCQSLSRWDGTSQGHFSKGRYLGKEFPGVSVFVGSWGLSSGSFSTDRVATGLEVPGFDLAAWFAPAALPSDHLLVFMPTGAVTSNDLPLLDGRYTLVVGKGIEAQPSGPPPGATTVTPRPPYFRLLAVEDAYRVELDTLGSVSVKQGLGAATGVALQASASASLPAPAAVAVAPGANQAPVVENVTISPGAPNLGAGLQGAVSKDDYLRITVEASDADGDPLMCRWGTSGGAFTSSQNGRMRWDNQKRRWISTWTFRANPQDPPLTTYDLTCEVTDPAGTLATAAAGVVLAPKIELRRKPFFVTNEWPPRALTICNEDGTDHVEVPLPSTAEFVSVHPDGNTIAFTIGDYSGTQFDIWSIQRDGSGLRKLFNNASCGSYSPDGTKYVFSRGGRIEVAPACGEVDPTPAAVAQLPPRQLIMPAGVSPAWWRPTMKADNKKVVFCGRLAGPTREALYCYDLDTDSCVEIGAIVNRPLDDTMYRFQYCRNPLFPNALIGIRKPDHNTWQVCTVNDDGSNWRVLANPSLPGDAACVSALRDGLGYLLVDHHRASRFDLDLASGVISNFENVLEKPNVYDVDCW